MNAGAAFSADRVYRYALWREWDWTLPQFVVIGLNPSTADEMTDDPTIRRCLGFARREGCGKLVMLNLFAFRATDPKQMFAAVDPVGPQNDEQLKIVAGDKTPTTVVAAWGAHGSAERVAEVAAMFPNLRCFGRNKDGSPKHPLYLPATAKLVRYRGNGSSLPAEQPPRDAEAK